MARIRTIKPELFTHDGLYEAEQQTGLPLRLSFIGLLTVADREGRFKWRPRAIKLDVLPYDDGVNFEAVLLALCHAGFLMRYEVDGEFYGCIPSFSKHQHVNVREAQSSLPSPNPDERACMHMLAPANDGANTGSSHGEGNRKGKGKGKGIGKEGKEKNICPAEIGKVFDHWRKVMDSWRSVLDPKRTALIEDALTLGYTEADLCKAIDGCKASAWHMGENDRSTKFNGIELILRNAEKIDAFMAMADAPPPKPKPPTIHDQRAATIAGLTGRNKRNDKPDPFTIDA